MKSAGTLLVALALIWAQAERLPASDSLPVAVDVQVEDEDMGEILELLGPKDFEIYENGRKCTIRGLEIETTPLDVVFLLYGPESWGEPNEWNEMTKALQTAVSALNPEDRAGVLRSDSESKNAVPLGPDMGRIQDALRIRNTAFPSISHDHLFQAVNAANTLLPKSAKRDRRRVILAITDDIEKKSNVTMDELITVLLDSNTIVNAVLVLTGSRDSSRSQAANSGSGSHREFSLWPSGRASSLRPVIQATGGEAISVDVFKKDPEELIRRLRLRYLLRYDTEAATKQEYRTIEVKLSPDARKQYPGASIKAPRGHYAYPADAR
jgi:VWFA-related protein